MADYKIRDMRLVEDDRIKEVKIGKSGMFKIKALFPVDYKTIARRMAIEQEGLPANSFTFNERSRFQRDATVEVAVVDSPDWWDGVDRCADEDVLESLYTEIAAWTDEFQKALKKNKLGRRGAESSVPN